MSNRIEFYQSEQTTLALPASRACVLLDGAANPGLEPLEIVRAGWPEFGWASIAFNAPLSDGQDLSLSYGDIGQAQQVCIAQCCNASPPDHGISYLPLFAGCIDTAETTFGPEGETVIVTARDFSMNLREATVYGRRMRMSDGSSVLFEGLDTIFNPEGRPNADSKAHLGEDSGYPLFTAHHAESRLWSYANAIGYLLGEYTVPGQLSVPAARQLRALTDNQIVRDLDVTGLNVLDALHRCCQRVGLRFYFVPRLCETGPAQAIIFYRDTTCRTVELSCQLAGEQTSISKTDVARIHCSCQLRPPAKRYVGQGDFKVHEMTFDLVQAWDPSLEGTDYEVFSPLTNADFHQVRDVFRKWCLNEAGDYSDIPYSRGPAFDFSGLFGTDHYVQRRRRFWPCLSSDAQGNSFGYFLQASFDGGATWWQYLYAFNNLLNECGIWLSSDQLDMDTWIAALKGVLRFRITAAVVSDERLTCCVADGPLNGVGPVTDHVMTMPRQFKYRMVSPKSIFYRCDDPTVGLADEVDDSDSLYEFVRHQAVHRRGIVERTEVQTPYLVTIYHVGDQVRSGVDSRAMPALRNDPRSDCRIERVCIDFKHQRTDLKLVRMRL